MFANVNARKRTPR